MEQNGTSDKVRIVHISDTHGLHDQYLSDDVIPHGDVLVHSGDFCCSSIKKYLRKKAYLQEDIRSLNEFFSKLPHKHKIFVAGNHEMSLGAIPAEDVQSLLKHCIYLQDSSVVIEGIKFYGSPWNGWRISTHARGFSVRYGRSLGRHWDAIPDDTDVMITHNPAQGIMDVSADKSLLKQHGACDVCGDRHPGANHWGCPHLKRTLLNRVK